jgi:ADP-ribosylglycohydrolase
MNQARRRALRSLEGLSVGDAFGETFFGPSEEAVARIRRRELKPAPWRWTDDTEMAVSLVEQLLVLGRVDQDDLAQRFAKRMTYTRGYGQGAYVILSGIRDGEPWQRLTRQGFRGMGSFGNGAAMRVAPLGAFFADQEMARVVEEARLSAEITHSHDEGIAGAIAIAVAAALACRPPSDLIAEVLRHTPRGYTWDAIDEIRGLPSDCSVVDAATKLGNGSGVTAPDTVPLCLWALARHWGSYGEALWTTVAALGDRDTTCAIVGGLCVLTDDNIPGEWRAAREPLP